MVVEGKVGIGTENPQEKLEVAGSILIPWNSAGYYIKDKDGKGAIHALSVGVDNNLYLGGNDLFGGIPNTRIIFRAGNQERMYICSNGRVGIGVTAPTRTLDVSGYVKGRSGLCIGNDCRNAWPGVERITIQEWKDIGNGANLGQWDYCALTLVAGIDDKGDEGVGVYPSKTGSWNPPNGRPTWFVWRGRDVDHFRIVCIKIGD